MKNFICICTTGSLLFSVKNLNVFCLTNQFQIFEILVFQDSFFYLFQREKRGFCIDGKLTDPLFVVQISSEGIYMRFIRPKNVWHVHVNPDAASLSRDFT